jgi:hypothetical protein
MRGDLRRYDVRKHAFTIADDRGGSLVA